MRLTSTFVVVPRENIDTDQIIPARYLKTTDKTNLGVGCFADWPDRPVAAGARVLVTGRNFGCGSSREHAPWALLGAGFQAVISPSFADIFANNALKNGLLPVALDDHAVRVLTDALPGATVTIDLADQCVTLPDGTTASFAIDPFAKHCVLHGVDQLGFLLAASTAIDAYEASHTQVR